MQAAALRARGWSISAIARPRPGPQDREGLSERQTLAGERKRTEPDPFDAIVAYVAQRLADDAHVWPALYMTRWLPWATRSVPELHPRLETQTPAPPLRSVRRRERPGHRRIPHPPGAECQWDWDELPDAPWGGDGHLLVGTLPYSGEFRGVFAEAEDQGHVISGIDTVVRALAGRPGRGALTAWQPSWTPPAASHAPVLPRWPSIIRW